MPIIGQWAFEDSDGTGVDTSGNGNTAAFTDGAFQNATGSAEFDGVNDCVEISDAAQYATTNATIHGTFTVAVGSLDGTLSTTVNDPSLQALVSRDSSGFDGGGHLTVYVDGDGSIYIRHQSDTQDYEIRTTPGLVTEGQEFDLVYEFGDTGGMVLYVDGVQVGSNTDPVSNGDSIALSGNNEPWTLGASQVLSGDGVADGLQQFFEGSIGHFEIYDEALSPAELNVLHDLSDGVDDGLIAGTAGDDTIFGGPSVNAEDGGLVIDDTITAGDGADVVYAGDGNDSVSGGAGADSMLGGSGADTLYGNDGADTIDGGDGADRIEGGAGNDSITGGLGDDYILGDAGDDTLSGGDGADTVLGGTEADDISGGDGTDILYGNLGNDTIVGGAGNDTIYVVGGDDSIDAGDDDDYIAMFDNFGNDTVAGGEGGSDTDQIDLQNLTSGVIVTFTGAEAGTISDGTDTVQFSEVEHFNLTGQADSLDGSASTAYMGVAGGAGNDTITTGSGDDIVLGGLGDDQIQGGQGNDSLDGGDGADVVLGGTENDTIIGGAGNDLLYGNDGTDIVDGGSGNDVIWVGGGSDMIDGGDDADQINFIDGFGADTVIGGEGGADTDIISLEYLTTGVTGSLSGNEAGSIGDGTNTIHFTEVENVILTGQDDAFDGAAATSYIGLAGGAGNDTLTGGAGDDLILGGDGQDVLSGGAGADNIAGDAGNDSITGGAGADTISGGLGNDTIAGGTGDDSLDGGEGADRFVIQNNGGSDTIQGGEGTDRVDLSSLTSGVTVTFTAPYAGTISDGTDTITFSETEIYDLTGQADVVYGGTSSMNFYGGGGDDALFGSTQNDGIFGGFGDDTITGGDGRDHLRGAEGADSIEGGAGGDWLYGGDADDTIEGGEGDDDIGGDAGADTLVGGAGDDTITTGAGDDLVVLEQLGAYDTVTDFDIGDTDGNGLSNDQLDVSDLRDLDGNPVNVWDVVVSDDGSGNAVLTFPEGESLTLQGIAPAQMTGPQMMASGIPCFTAGTMILTPQGERPVEELRVGDLVTTQDRGPQPIRWMAQRSLGPQDLAGSPELRPVRLNADWTGTGRDLVVSRQHGIVACKAGDDTAFFVRANQLALMNGGKVRVARGIRRVTYVHLLFPRHEIIYANGTAVESFYPGPWSMESLATHSVLSLNAYLPGLAVDGPEAAYGPSALGYIRTSDLPKSLSGLTVGKMRCPRIA